jgi:hypothetical protein
MKRISFLPIFILVALIGMADTPLILNFGSIPIEHSEEMPEHETNFNLPNSLAQVRLNRSFTHTTSVATPIISCRSLPKHSFFSFHSTTPRFVLNWAFRC